MRRRAKGWLRGWLLAAIALSVCAAQTLPKFPSTPSLGAQSSDLPPGAARITQMVGDVSVLKEAFPWALKIGDTISPKQVVLTGEDGYALFELEDGSTFEVFPNSRVTFRANQGDWGDLLDLWLGRVKVYIQKFGDQPNRNRIFTPTAVISVRGTIFDVIIEDEADTTLVSVDEGVVDVRHRLIGESRSKTVTEGEYIRVYKNIPLAKQMIDRNALMERIFRAATDAVYTIMVQYPRGGGGTPGGGGGVPTSTGGGPTLPGDTGGAAPPPTPPASGGGPATAPAPAPPAGPPVPPAPPPPPPPGG